MKKILIVSTAFLFFFLPAITQEIYQINCSPPDLLSAFFPNLTE